MFVVRSKSSIFVVLKLHLSTSNPHYLKELPNPLIPKYGDVIGGIVPPWNSCNGYPTYLSTSSFSSGKGNTAFFIA